MRRLLLLSSVIAVSYLAWLHETRLPIRDVAAPSQTLFVAPGSSVASVGRQLHGLGYVRHPWVFRAVVVSRGESAQLKAGDYLLEGPLSLTQIVDMLVQGASTRRDLTFPEGKNLQEMAAIAEAGGLSGKDFLAAAREPALMLDLDPRAENLEGYLFPDTYDVPPERTTARVLVTRMVKRFRDVAGPETGRRRKRGLTLRRWVTLASLVELETAREEERPRIAAVFLNRLDKGMRLQTDPTVIYALRLAGTYDGNIRKKDLSVDSPYNTYRHRGLPPGPIAAPGREALLAVLHPADVQDLYFVSRNDGTHHFSRTLTEHEHAVDRFQRRRRRPRS